jgi:hypothetical protein
MPGVEVVWRHLLVGTLGGQRRWPSVVAMATVLDMPVSTTHRSLAHPVEIEAVAISHSAGLQVLDPWQSLMLFAAHRHVQRDIVRRFRVDVPASEVEALAASQTTVLGGFGAVVAHTGVNRIADYDTVLFYGEPELPALPPAAAGEGTEVLVAVPDPRLARYGRVTPLAQAYADLFSLPGWPATRFVSELDAGLVSGASRDPELLI